MTMQLSQFRRTTLAQTAAFIAGTVMAFNALAADPFNVRDIRVEGLQRVEPGTVFASIPFRVGDDYTDEKGAAAIRSLFALGLFKDVRIEVNGDVLVLIVEERPNIAAVEFIGTKEFDKDTLKKALKDIGLAEGRPFDKALADRAEQELKRQYVNRSLYGAEIITTITPAERNRVNLSFTVVEGDLAKIKEMRVVGAKAFDESKLLDQFDQGTGNWLSWYTKSDRYSRTKLNGDLEALGVHRINQSRVQLQGGLTAREHDIGRLPVAGTEIGFGYGKGQTFRISELPATGAIGAHKIGVAKFANGRFAVFFPPRPQIATCKAAKHSCAPCLGALTLQGIKHLFDGVSGHGCNGEKTWRNAN